jgi:hypothetical protein
MQRLQPTNRAIAGVAVLLFALVLLGVGLHHIIVTGNCSSTGYNSYGPVAHCPEGSGWWAGFLVGGIVLSIAGGLISGGSGPLLIAPAVFCAVGAGALSVQLDGSAGSDNKTFGLIFGGFFLAGGLIWLALMVRAALGGGAASPLAPLGTTPLGTTPLGTTPPAPTVTTDPITGEPSAPAGVRREL